MGRQGWSVWVGLRIPLILVKFITHARSRFFVTFPVIPKRISRVFQNVGIRFLVVLIHHMRRKFFNTRVCRSRNDIEEEIVLFNLNALPPVSTPPPPPPPPPPRLNLQKTLVAQTLSNFCSLHIAYFSIKVPTLHSQTYLSQKIRNFLTFSSLCFKCHHHQARLKLFFRITF